MEIPFNSQTFSQVCAVGLLLSRLCSCQHSFDVLGACDEWVHHGLFRKVAQQ